MTRQRLREVLLYNPCTGHFNWRRRSSNFSRVTIGERAGCVDTNGYRRIRIDMRYYRACRLAWFYCYGEWPNVIDHLDENKANDSVFNLLNVSQAENMRRYYHNRS